MGATVSHVLAARVLRRSRMVFVYRSFYGMRIGSAATERRAGWNRVAAGLLHASCPSDSRHLRRCC